VGIGLEHKQTVEGRFYAKTDYMLSKKLRFACLLAFDGKIEDGLIQIGAEGSMFRMEVKHLEETALVSHPLVSCMFEPTEHGTKMVALSDVLVEESEALHAKFALVPYLKRFAPLKTHKGKYVGTHKVRTVIPAGSVVYMHEGKLPQCIEGAYTKMGYNRFVAL
jgi:hypothetical protein